MLGVEQRCFVQSVPRILQQTAIELSFCWVSLFRPLNGTLKFDYPADIPLAYHSGILRYL